MRLSLSLTGLLVFCDLLLLCLVKYDCLGFGSTTSKKKIIVFPLVPAVDCKTILMFLRCESYEAARTSKTKFGPGSKIQTGEFLEKTMAVL